jgi:hypothetical protein
MVVVFLPCVCGVVLCFFAVVLTFITPTGLVALHIQCYRLGAALLLAAGPLQPVHGVGAEQRRDDVVLCRVGSSGGNLERVVVVVAVGPFAAPRERV